MRRGNHGKGIIYLEDDKTFLGANLGADFTAEHEWGIQSLKSTYGIDDNAEGIARKQVSRFPEDRFLFGDIQLGKSRGTWWGLVSLRYDTDRKYHPELTADLVDRCELHPYGDADIVGSWDEGSFGVLLKSEEIANELHDAFRKCDVCIGLFNGEAWNPFSRSGLGFAIASRLPDVVKQGWLESDRDARRLSKASEATGIADRLKEAGLWYFALSPKWSTEIRETKRGEMKTDHPVIYWLNPMDQDRNNCGWFTVEQLDQWIKGKGPIPKAA